MNEASYTGENLFSDMLDLLIQLKENRDKNRFCFFLKLGANMLKNNFYVDNLIKSHNCPRRLQSLYQEAVKIMSEGGILLRSCNSNNTELRSQMNKDGSLVVHDSPWEKVLGYLYNPTTDKMRVSCSSLRAGASTKRKYSRKILAFLTL